MKVLDIKRGNAVLKSNWMNEELQGKLKEVTEMHV